MNHLHLVSKTDVVQNEATLCMLAALADHHITDAERTKIASQIRELSIDEITSFYHNVLVLKPSVEEVLEKMEETTGKKETYQLALEVCIADGDLQKKERYMLSKIRSWAENKPYKTLGKSQLLAPLKGVKKKVKAIFHKRNWGEATSAVTGGHPEEINGL